ncbi:MULTISPECIES: hypothetical protein [Pseudomonas]|nr:hypothetical protein [Pseudomonas huaxiensis]
MTVIARTIPDLVKALHRQGFFLVSDLPPIRPQLRRGMIVVRLP